RIDRRLTKSSPGSSHFSRDERQILERMMNESRGETFGGGRFHLSSRVPHALAQRGMITSCSRLRSWLGAHYWWLWTFVGVVSLYDAWLVVVFREMIHQTERNP